MGGFPGLSGETPPEPSLVETDDGWAFALLVERGPPGFCTVFLPDSPTPTESGSVRLVDATRVRPLDASMLNLLACLTRSGAGAGTLAGRALADRGVGAGIRDVTDRPESILIAPQPDPQPTLVP